jgi:hypothetical protein
MIPSKLYWVAVTALLLSLITFIPEVPGQQPMDMMSCGDATVTTIVAGQDLTIMGIEGKGINLDNLASKAFDNMTYHTVGTYKIESGKFTGLLYSKYMDPSGDYLVVEVSQVGIERDCMAPASGKGLSGEARQSLLPKASQYLQAPCRVASKSQEPMN